MISSQFNRNLGNILTVYAASDSYDRQDGLAAYSTYHTIIKSLADNSGVQVPNAIGAFAALSPNSTYKSNLSGLKECLHAFVLGKGPDDVSIATYPINKVKAFAILKGPSDKHTIFDMLGLKTGCFFLNILEPTDPTTVTVDGHMYSIWKLHPFKMSEAKVTSKIYHMIAADTRKAAKLVGILPSQMQATVWFTWKRINRIAFDTDELQPSLFSSRPDQYWS